LIEIRAQGWQKHRGILVVSLFVAIAILLGCVAATETLYGLLLALAGLGCIALAYIFFKNGRLSLDRVIIPLLIVAILFPSIRFSSELPAIRLELVIIIIAWALFILGHLAAGKPLRLRWNPTNKWFFLFGACILASMAYAAFVHGYYPIVRDFWEFGKLIEYFLIFALVASLNIPPEHMQKYYIISLIIFLCSAAFGFAQYFNLFDINSWLMPYYAPTKAYYITKAGRIVGATSNPNVFGAAMVLAASLALTGALWLKGRSIKLFSWAALGVFSLAIVFTLSRTALVCLLVIVAFIALYKYTMHFGFKKVVRLVVLVIPVLLVIAFILLQLAPERFFFRMGRGMDLGTDTSWQARQVMWQSAIDSWKQSPFLGWGPGKETMTASPHNDWLLLLRRYGTLGVLVFVLWFVGVYRTLSSIERGTKNSYTETFCAALQATLVAYAIFMIPLSVYHDLQVMPILLIFLGLAYTQRQSSRVVQRT
jgi:O-antigen ligase